MGFDPILEGSEEDLEFCDLHRNPEPCKRCEAMDRRREEQKDER